MTEQAPGQRRWLDVVSSIAFIVACLAVAWMAIDRTRKPAWPTATDQPTVKPVVVPQLAGPMSLEGVAQKGDPNATIAVIEYSDFQCPYCARFTQQVLPEIQRRFIDTGEVRWGFRHFPLDSIHSAARDAAKGAECARRQGRFWEMHQALFAEPKAVSQELIQRSASNIGLNLSEFGKCVSSAAVADVIKADVSAASVAGITGTPTFLVGRLQGDLVTVTELLEGARPPNEFAAAIERARAR